MRKIRNFTAAITNMPKKIREIATIQPSYFRTQKFTDLINENEKLLLNLIDCKSGRVAFLTASGTGAMDAAVSSIIGKDKKVLVVNAGTFGKRWLDICKFYRLKYNEFRVPFGKAIDFNRLEERIAYYKPDYLLMQHNETSSMQSYPVSTVGTICLCHNCKLIVDAIGSFAIDHYRMDKWNVYATVLSTQKGLGLTTGMSMVVVQEVPTIKGLSYYLDLKLYLKDLDDMGLPFTPNIITLNQLNYRLKEIQKVGIEKTICKTYMQAIDFRERIANLPLRYDSGLSNCGTLLHTYRTDVKDLFEKLQRKNIYFTPSGGTKGKKFIISHIGNLTKKDNKTIYKELNSWLRT